jgi:hypothetical protein
MALEQGIHTMVEPGIHTKGRLFAEKNTNNKNFDLTKKQNKHNRNCRHWNRVFTQWTNFGLKK